MTRDKEDAVGCEEHLYREMQCCLHPCSVQFCPEPICAIEFPGGKNAYLRYKKLKEILNEGVDIREAAERLNISTWSVKHIKKKGVYINASI